MKKNKICIVGLGYVGLPLARLFATKYSVVGYDINESRVEELNSGFDSTLELSEEFLKKVLKKNPSKENGLFCTNSKGDISDCNYYIITVPTPVNDKKTPILDPLISASETVGSILKTGDIIIYESTVFPGASEEICVPVLEKFSWLKFNKDFFLGYSPERINPGDKQHTVDKILKVTSGSTPEIAVRINDLYKSVISAGTHMAPSIKVAEAAKVIENSQRDINIAFVNELARIFNLMNIDTMDVLEAAGTKWNFLPFRPGLVGGHCIGVDPYYLTHKAEEFGYIPEIILAGRKMNDTMGDYIATQIINKMKLHKVNIEGSEILILGITFKENCPDVRNTKVVDLILSLNKFKVNVTIVDPWASPDEVKKEYGLSSSKNIPRKKFDAIILAVSHNDFRKIDLLKLKRKKSIIYDIKGFLGDKADARL